MQTNLLVKLSVVASSLLLGAAFVSYRAGAFDWSSRSDGTTVETPPIPPHPTVVAPPGGGVAPPTTAEQEIFYGSKSGAVFVEPQPTSQPTPEPPPQQPASPQTQQSAVIMSGSKSLMPAAPRQEAVHALQQAGGR